MRKTLIGLLHHLRSARAFACRSENFMRYFLNFAPAHRVLCLATVSSMGEPYGETSLGGTQGPWSCGLVQAHAWGPIHDSLFHPWLTTITFVSCKPPSSTMDSTSWTLLFTPSAPFRRANVLQNLRTNRSLLRTTGITIKRHAFLYLEPSFATSVLCSAFTIPASEWLFLGLDPQRPTSTSNYYTNRPQHQPSPSTSSLYLH